MLESTTNQSPEKSYNLAQVLVSSFFFSPFAVVYFIWQNFSKQSESTKKYIIISGSIRSCGWVAIYFLTNILLGMNNENYINTTTPYVVAFVGWCVNIIVAYVLYKKLYQRFPTTKSTYSWWRVIGIGIGCGIIFTLYTQLFSVILKGIISSGT